MLSTRTRLLALTVLAAIPAGGIAGTLDSIVYAEDFEGDDGGLFPGGTTPSWAHGSPTSGPGSAHSGGACWATGLAGDYLDNEDGYVTSPSIDLSGHPGGPLLFTWWQFLETERGFDTACLEISTDGGGTWERVYGKATGAVSNQWERQLVLLDESTAVPTFRYRFRLRADATTTAPGFYLDTIRIRALTHQLVIAEDFEGGDGGYTPTGALASWSFGTPVLGPGAAYSGTKAWATQLDGFYNSNEDSALVSPPLDLSAHPETAFLLSWRQHLVTDANGDFASVEARPAPGAPWVAVYGPTNGVVSDRWTRQTVLLGPQFATPTTQIRFRIEADALFQNTGFTIDDVEIHTIEGTSPSPTSWSSPAPIAAGTPLGPAQLNATSPVPGTFAYTPPAGSLLPAGPNFPLTALFTPADLLTHAPASVQTSITVTEGNSGYPAWAAANFPPGTPTSETQPEADYDRDGRSNLAEYAFATDPTEVAAIGEPRLVIVSDGGSNYLGLEFAARTDDPALSYHVESSDTLTNWTRSALTFSGTWSLTGGAVLVSATPSGAGTWLIRVRESAPLGTSAIRFLRVSADF